MKIHQSTRPLIRAAGIARRWGLQHETVSVMVAKGDLIPVVGSGRTALFALADVLRIEAGNSQPEVKSYDVTIEPLSSEARTSPVELFRRLNLALECIELAWSPVFTGELPSKIEDSLLVAVWTIREAIKGGSSCHVYEKPAIGQRERYGVNLAEPGARTGLLRIAHSALIHLLSSDEAAKTLQDLGPKVKVRFVHALEKMEEELLRRATMHH